MKAVISPLGAICRIYDGESVIDLRMDDLSVISECAINHISTANGEWHVISANNRDDLIHNAKELSLVFRAVSNIEACHLGLSTNLVFELLSQTELIQQGSDIGRAVLARLLRSPLLNTSVTTQIQNIALSNGLGATANIIEDLIDSQPQLNRLVSIWLSIPDNFFNPFMNGRSSIWNAAVSSFVILDSLSATNYNQLTGIWHNFTSSFSSPQERKCLFYITKLIASVLYPNHTSEDSLPDVSEDVVFEEELQRDSAPEGLNAEKSRERAIKQVNAIVYAIAKGDDQNARKFLLELRRDQLSYEDGERHAIKSLCNIAKSCADMFRVDFEYICLELALELAPTDTWTLLQLADHLKRSGKFDDALEKASYAETLSNSNENRIARSAIADILVQMQRYDDAVEKYHSIPGWQNDPLVQTALADLLRKRSLFSQARTIYNELINNGEANDRVYVGLAEILKQEGDYNTAIEYYDIALNYEGVDDTSLRIYSLGKANVLLRSGNYKVAYELADDAVRKSPFDARARIMRAAIAGILGRPNVAIKDLPFMGQTKAFSEWLSSFVRGLTLLMLNRNADAKRSLFAQIDKNLLDTESNSNRMLATAVYFLQSRSTVDSAALVLGRVPASNDAFHTAIRDVLAYHIAVTYNRRNDIDALTQKLSKSTDFDLRATITAITQRDWRAVKRLQVKLMLRLAS